jgi:hypothetical protein
MSKPTPARKTDEDTVTSVPSPSSFLGKILKHLNLLGSIGHETAIPDRTNTGKLLGEYFLYNEVRKWAEARSERAWKTLLSQGLVEDPAKLPPGDHGLATSTHFILSAKVSQPVRRFDAAVLAAELKKKYKVPESSTIELCEKAKVPTKPQCTKTIAERA